MEYISCLVLTVLLMFHSPYPVACRVSDLTKRCDLFVENTHRHATGGILIFIMHCF